MQSEDNGRNESINTQTNEQPLFPEQKQNQNERTIWRGYMFYFGNNLDLIPQEFHSRFKMNTWYLREYFPPNEEQKNKKWPKDGNWDGNCQYDRPWDTKDGCDAINPMHEIRVTKQSLCGPDDERKGLDCLRVPNMAGQPVTIIGKKSNGVITIEHMMSFDYQITDHQ